MLMIGKIHFCEIIHLYIVVKLYIVFVVLIFAMCEKYRVIFTKSRTCTTKEIRPEESSGHTIVLCNNNLNSDLW